MSRHDDQVRLKHMVDHANEAITMLRGHRREDLESDRQLNLALVRLLEIVGEAAARIEPALQAKIPGVPWSQVIGLRHRLIHGYDDVDFDILWRIVSDDLPPLVLQIETFLEDSKPGTP